MNKDRFMDCYHHNPGATIPRDSRWRLFFETRNQPFVTAAKPDLTSATFVAGSNRCLVVIREREGGWDASLRRLNSVRNITSVDWLDHNTYLTGERSGAVRLWDIRHNGRSLRFKFPAPITHAKKLGDQRIVVAGKNNNVSPPPSFSMFFSSLTRHPQYFSFTYTISAPPLSSMPTEWVGHTWRLGHIVTRTSTDSTPASTFTIISSPPPPATVMYNCSTKTPGMKYQSV